ncbi:glycosylphosphatidylinositol anchor biosynthesis [Gryganskiella cystojenkinii]|nr:glycosylphosphatidylinositol anchor biosynthesis [Gryganskiella cystojenkinii]
MRAYQLSDRQLLISLLAFRVLNSLLVKTFFSPDEYWQALEVGHRITFGYGYLTWEWGSVALRSVLHPALFAALYKLLSLLGLEDGSLFIYAPRILQSVFAALADLYAYKFAYRLFENQVIANWTLYLSVISWWNFFCSTRTLANSLEAALTIVALYYWPFTPSKTGSGSTRRVGSNIKENKTLTQQGSLTIALVIASLTCIFRPTSAILWIFLGLSILASDFFKGNLKAVATTIVSVILIGGAAVLGSAVLDTALLYGSWTLTPLNFLRVNVLEGISLFYGSSPWHWYLSQGIPILFGIYIPLVLFGSYKAWKTPSDTGLNASLKHQVLYLCAWVLVVYSSLQHKEWRFLYPILYPLLAFGGDAMYSLSISAGTQGWKSSRKMIVVVLVLVVVNAVMAWYTTLVHQRGVVDVMDWIREQAREEKIDDIDASTYKDESDIFYKDPKRYLLTRFVTKKARVYGDDGLPHPLRTEQDSHLVFFEDLVRTHPDTLEWLSTYHYKECARFFNSHFHDDSRRRGDVLVYCQDYSSFA